MAFIGVETGVGKFLALDISKDDSMEPGMRFLKEYYVFSYILKGAGYYRDTNGYEAILEPGDMIINFPDLGNHYNRVPGGHWTQFWFTFDKSVFAPWQACKILDPAQPVHHLAPVDHWYKRFKVIFDTVTANMRWNPMLILIRFQEILMEALCAEEVATTQHDLVWADQVCEILKDNTSKLKSLPAIAKQLGLSYDTFRKRFNRIVGLSPLQYRNRFLIECACKLMQETHLNIKEIAFRLGFYDEFHFSRRFKQIVGLSPKDFRRTFPLNTKSAPK